MIILLFLQISIILGLYIVQSSLLAQKMSRGQWQRHEALFMAENLLHEIEVNLIDNFRKCFIPIMSGSELLTKNLDWWQSSISCAGVLDKKFKYYYVIEALGEDACADVEPFAAINILNNLNKAVYYFRITLLIMDVKNNTRELLQNTIIKLDNALHECSGRRHPVTLGMQAWHTL